MPANMISQGKSFPSLQRLGGKLHNPGISNDFKKFISSKGGSKKSNSPKSQGKKF